MWRLVDLKTGQPLARRVERADTFGARLKGLLGRAGLEAEEGLWIEPCDSVHTFFMRFPIDVAFLDREGVVVAAAERLVPWRATRIHARARSCVELAAGVLGRYGVRPGARLALVLDPEPSGAL